MPGPIGQDYEDAATPGSTGSMNAKLRLMTSQLANLTITSVPSTGATVVSQTAGPWAVSGTVMVGNSPNVGQTAGPWAVSGTVMVGNSPNVGQTAGPWAVSGTVSLTPTAAPADGATNSALYGVANYGMLLNGAGTWDRIRSAGATSGTTGAGLWGAGSMVFDGTLWWPKKGNNTAQYSQGPAASGALFVGNPLVVAGLYTSGAVAPLQLAMPLATDGVGRLLIQGPVAENTTVAGINPVVMAGVDSVGGSIRALLTTTADGQSPTRTLGTGLMLFNGGTTLDRIRSANAASGTTGTGLLGAGNLVYDPLVTGWFNWRGSAVGGGFVQGPAANSTSTVGNPVWVAAATTGNNLRGLTVFSPGDGVGDPGNELGVNAVGALFNGTNYDRMRGANAASGTLGTGLLGAGSMIYDGTAWWPWRNAGSTTTGLSNQTVPAVQLMAFQAGGTVNAIAAAGVVGDTSNGQQSLGVGTYAYNGASWDRTRSANGASGTVGAGLLGAGGMVHDGTLWWPLKTPVAADVGAIGILGTGLMLNNGAGAWNYIQNANAVIDGTNGSRMQVGLGMVFNGGTHDRLRNNIITNQFTGTNTTSGATVHATQVNYNNSGLIATLNITAASGTLPNLTVKIQIADGAGTFYDLTDSAGNTVAFQAQTGVGTDTLKLAPGLVERLTASPNKQYNSQLPRSYRFVSTVTGNLMSFTYRLDVSELK